MSRILNIYIIHSKHLTIRASRFNNTLRTIDEVAKNNYLVKSHFILQYEANDIQSKIDDYNKLVSYDPINDSDFDNQRYMLSIQLISNIEKHKEAWRRIQAMQENSGDLYLILEDDALLFPECVNNFSEFLKMENINASSKAIHEWDMITFGLSMNNVDPNSKLLLNFRDIYKVLPSKEAYCITPSIAKLFLENTNKFKFTLRLQLSYMIKMNPSIKIMFPSKRIFIDGSKLGIFPSTLHPTNILTFNNEYIQLHKYIQKSPDEIKSAFTQIKKYIK
jgi:hypothetical protein